MGMRVIIGIGLYFAAIAAPTAWLYIEYGPFVPVDLDSADDLVRLVGAIALAFVLGLAASIVARPSTPSHFDALREMLRSIEQIRSGADAESVEARR